MRIQSKGSPFEQIWYAKQNFQIPTIVCMDRAKLGDGQKNQYVVVLTALWPMQMQIWPTLAQDALQNAKLFRNLQTFNGHLHFAQKNFCAILCDP